MRQREPTMRRLGALALAAGCVGLAACVSLIVFFMVGAPFGFINDLGNAALAVLVGALAVGSLRLSESKGTTLRITTILAILGMVVSVIGSVMVIFDITGYFLAGLVSASGFALIGSWLATINRSGAGPPLLRSSPRQATLGVGAGAVMAIGFVNVPAIVMGIDDMDTAPGWLLAAGICWMGTYLLMPIWCVWISQTFGPS